MNFVELQQMKHVDSSISLLMLGLMVSTSDLFLYCFFGKMSTDSFAMIGENAYEINWQRFSIKLQRYFILMIGNGQRSLYFRACGMTILDLETFTQVSSISIAIQITYDL